MKFFYLLVLTALAAVVAAEEPRALSPDELQERVIEINDAGNKVFMNDSTPADVDALFANYTDDFVYIHEVYGGTYSREELYENTLIRVKERRYKRTSDRYKVVAMISGYNGIAVQRELNDNGKKHLAVFEFEGDKVSRILEYWK